MRLIILLLRMVVCWRAIVAPLRTTNAFRAASRVVGGVGSHAFLRQQTNSLLSSNHQRAECKPRRPQVTQTSLFSSTTSSQVVNETTRIQNNDEESSPIIAVEEHTPYSIILDGLNPSQVEATTRPIRGITRVVAGPGSGKTRVLTCRIAYLLQEDRRSNILAVTFTRKAAGEMQERVRKLLQQQHDLERQQQSPSIPAVNGSDEDGVVDTSEDEESSLPKGLDRVELGTFHSVCAKILRYNGNLLSSLPSVQRDMMGSLNVPALDSGFVIVDQGEQLRIVNEYLAQEKIDLKESNLNVRPIDILSRISRMKDVYASGGDPFVDKKNRGPSPVKRMARQVYGYYRETLLSNNSLDFDDLIHMTRELLIQNPEIREMLHRRWPHVLVDEFQDTSRVQMDLVKLLTSNSLFVVGDADQSIYSWRGAHVGSMADFSKDFKENPNPLHTVYLMENYRSTTNIVRAAEKVINYSYNSNSASPAPGTLQREAMKPIRGKGAAPRIVACADEEAEAKFVVDNVLGMLADGTISQDSTVAVIYRTNVQSRRIEEACVKNNLPYVIRGAAGGFYKRIEIKDSLCFLRWLCNGRDQGSMLRAMKTPTKGIGDVAVNEFNNYCNEVETYYKENHPGKTIPTQLDILISLSDVERDAEATLVDGAPEAKIFMPKRALNRFIPFSIQMSAIRDTAYKKPLNELLVFVNDHLKLKDHFDAISKTKAEFQERMENVLELQQATEKYSKRGPALKVDMGSTNNFEENISPLSEFLDDVALVTDIKGESDSADNRLVVSLTTIHAAKGMEYDTVFVIGNEEGTLPSALAKDDVQIEEEKRLCYVAMTRAKSRLIMTWRKEKSIFTPKGIKFIDMKRSQFLDALAPQKSGSQKGKPSNKASSNTTQPRPRASNQRSSSNGPIPASSNRRPKAASSSSAMRAPSKPNPVSPVGKRRYTSSVSSTSTNSRADDASRPSKSPVSRMRIDAGRRSSPPPAGVRSPTRTGVSQRQPFPNNGKMNSRASPTRQKAPLPSNPTLSSRPNKARQSPSESPARSVIAPKRAPTSRNSVPVPQDSTWIFPVGSSVIHANFGPGKVLQPPPANGSSEILVRIQFENGMTKELPAAAKELMPDF